MSFFWRLVKLIAVPRKKTDRQPAAVLSLDNPSISSISLVTYGALDVTKAAGPL